MKNQPISFPLYADPLVNSDHVPLFIDIDFPSDNSATKLTEGFKMVSQNILARMRAKKDGRYGNNPYNKEESDEEYAQRLASLGKAADSYNVPILALQEVDRNIKFLGNNYIRLESKHQNEQGATAIFIDKNINPSLMEIIPEDKIWEEADKPLKDEINQRLIALRKQFNITQNTEERAALYKHLNHLSNQLNKLRASRGAGTLAAGENDLLNQLEKMVATLEKKIKAIDDKIKPDEDKINAELKPYKDAKSGALRFTCASVKKLPNGPTTLVISVHGKGDFANVRHIQRNMERVFSNIKNNYVGPGKKFDGIVFAGDFNKAKFQEQELEDMRVSTHGTSIGSNYMEISDASDIKFRAETTDQVLSSWPASVEYPQLYIKNGEPYIDHLGNQAYQGVDVRAKWVTVTKHAIKQKVSFCDRLKAETRRILVTPLDADKKLLTDKGYSLVGNAKDMSISDADSAVVNTLINLAKKYNEGMKFVESVITTAWQQRGLRRLNSKVPYIRKMQLFSKDFQDEMKQQGIETCNIKATKDVGMRTLHITPMQLNLFKKEALLIDLGSSLKI